MSNPYELRFSLLQMAQGYLQEQQERRENFAHHAWEYAKSRNSTETPTMEVFKGLQPETYTIDDIKNKAAELYEFVEKQ